MRDTNPESVQDRCAVAILRHDCTGANYADQLRRPDMGQTFTLIELRKIFGKEVET